MILSFAQIKLRSIFIQPRLISLSVTESTLLNKDLSKILSMMTLSSLKDLQTYLYKSVHLLSGPFLLHLLYIAQPTYLLLQLAIVFAIYSVHCYFDYSISHMLYLGFFLNPCKLCLAFVFVFSFDLCCIFLTYFIISMFHIHMSQLTLCIHYRL